MNVPTHRAARIRRLAHKKRMVFFFLTGFPSHRRRPAPVHVSLYSTRVRNGSHIPHFLPTFHLADHKHSRTAHLRSTGVCRRQNLGTGKTHFRRAPQFHTVPIKTAAPEGAAVRLSTKSTASLKNASIFSKRCGLLRRTSSGQSPHRSPRPDGQASLCSLAPPLPNKPASLGFVWVPISHACRPRSVFSEAHVPGKNKFNLIPSSADDGTLRGSCTKFGAFLLFRPADSRTRRCGCLTFVVEEDVTVSKSAPWCLRTPIRLLSSHYMRFFFLPPQTRL